MKTAYYTFTTWSDSAMAAGFGGAANGPRQAVMVRQPEPGSRVQDGDKVIDLTAWRAENLDDFSGESLDGLDETEPAIPAPRSRRSRRAMLTAELISTLSVVAVAAAIIVRVLTF